MPLIYTDEYRIYNRLTEWEYKHESVNYGAGEYARDEDEDEGHEVHYIFLVVFLLTRISPRQPKVKRSNVDGSGTSAIETLPL